MSGISGIGGVQGNIGVLGNGAFFGHGCGAGAGAGSGMSKCLRIHRRILLGGTSDLPTSQGCKDGIKRHPLEPGHSQLTWRPLCGSLSNRNLQPAPQSYHLPSPQGSVSPVGEFCT
jgi:hypothetical protein